MRGSATSRVQKSSLARAILASPFGWTIVGIVLFPAALVMGRLTHSSTDAWLAVPGIFFAGTLARFILS
jgi:hypothetical protein